MPAKKKHMVPMQVFEELDKIREELDRLKGAKPQYLMEVSRGTLEILIGVWDEVPKMLMGMSTDMSELSEVLSDLSVSLRMKP